MLLSAIDPALLIFHPEHWQSMQPHFFSRLKCLLMHYRIMKEHNQQIAMSNDIAALIQENFPWGQEHKDLAELRDLRRFMLEELVKARYLDDPESCKCLSVQPDGLTCQYVESSTIRDAWHKLLCSLFEKETTCEFDAQIVAWNESVTAADTRELTITIISDNGEEDYLLPLVWDEDTWISRLSSEDLWPDLQKCVELYFLSNAGMRCHPLSRQPPMEFECTEEFWKSLDDLCQPRMRQLLIKAVTKRVYGILDNRLHDEPLGGLRRFRVTDFWRVHYRLNGNQILLVEFGPHDIGL